MGGCCFSCKHTSQKAPANGQVPVRFVPFLGLEWSAFAMRGRWLTGVTMVQWLFSPPLIIRLVCRSCFTLPIAVFFKTITSPYFCPCWLPRSSFHGPTSVPCPLPVLRGERWAVLPAVPEVSRHGPGSALQHRQLLPAHLHDRTRHWPKGGLRVGKKRCSLPTVLSSWILWHEKN